MMTTLVTMNAAVVAFPSIDGLKVRGPIARLTIATTARITTSRLITTTVSHSGRWFVSGMPGKRQDDEGRDEEELVGHRIEPGAEAGALAGASGDQPVKGVCRPRRDEHQQRRAKPAIDDQQHERGDQDDPQDRQLVREGQVTQGISGTAASVDR